MQPWLDDSDLQSHFVFYGNLIISAKKVPSHSWQSGLFCFRQSSGCFHNYTLTCVEQTHSSKAILSQHDQTLSDLFYLKEVTSQINSFCGRLQYEKNKLFRNYSPFLFLLSHLVYRAINKFTLAKNVALELTRQPHHSSTSWSFIFSPFFLLPSGDFMSLQHFLIPCCQSGRVARRWSEGTFFGAFPEGQWLLAVTTVLQGVLCITGTSPPGT